MYGLFVCRVTSRARARSAHLRAHEPRIAVSGPGTATIWTWTAACYASSAAAPPALLIAPPCIKATGTALELGYDGAAGKSAAISEHSQAVARARGCAFLDAAGVVSSSDDDGVHLDAEAHVAFGNAIAEWIRTLI